jgi:proline iminopeptidase
MTALWLIPVVIAGILAVLISGAFLTQRFVRTPPFRDAEGKIRPESIAEFRRVPIGEDTQAILIRGENRANPVVLLLHAGPCLSEMGLMRNINAELETHFTMVYWDQRGAGKSYTPLQNYARTFTMERLLEDIRDMTAFLKKHLGVSRIVLMGHSFGAGFGAMAAAKHPEDYAVFVGIAQAVVPTEADRLSYGRALNRAMETGNQRAVEELRRIEGYWTRRTKNEYFPPMMVLKKWIGFFGWQIVGQTNFVPYVLKRLRCTEFTVFDYPPYMLGMLAGGAASFDIFIKANLREQALAFKMPVVFMTGRHDHNTVTELVEGYFAMIDAPKKDMIWFENSAHFPHIEEPEVFRKAMIETVLPLARANA